MAHSNAPAIIVALDVPTVADAQRLVAAIGPSCSFYKVGLELIMAGGLELARELVSTGKRVFLDMKLHDIGNTVEHATANAARLGVTFLSVHAQDQKTVSAAVSGRGSSGLKLLAITVLTNLTREDLQQQGIGKDPSQVVVDRAVMARNAGFDAVVCSGQEAASVREAVGTKMLIVTPGIRFADGAIDDQARVLTPELAVKSGANYLVVGRPITRAEDPRAAADRFAAALHAAR